MSPLDPEERALLDAILADPDNDDLRLIYADWLEERGDPRAEYVRGEVAYHGCNPFSAEKRQVLRSELIRVRSKVPGDWVAQLARLRVERCPSVKPALRFEFVCDRRWQQMLPTPEPNIRHFESCDRNVHYCETIDEAWQSARDSRCVALDSSVTRYVDDLSSTAVVGVVDIVEQDELHPRERVH